MDCLLFLAPAAKSSNPRPQGQGVTIWLGLSITGKKAKLFDGGGLYLEVTPAGGKIFRLKYRIVHVEEDRIRVAYLRTDYMNERHEIMQ